MNIVISSLSNAAIWIDGIGLAGRAAEFEVPMQKTIMQDYSGLGLNSKIELPMGKDKLEANIKWSSFDITVLLPAADGDPHLLAAYGNQKVFSAGVLVGEYPVICNITGNCKDAGKINLAAQKNVEITTVWTVTHSELWVAGVQIYLFDAYANIDSVGGVDQLALFRANLGG